jgi:hypothetical protein
MSMLALAAYLTFQVFFSEDLTIANILRLTVSSLAFFVFLPYTILFKNEKGLRFKHLTLLLFIFGTAYALAIPDQLTTYASSYIFLTLVTSIGGLLPFTKTAGQFAKVLGYVLFVLLFALGFLIFSKTPSTTMYTVVGIFLIIVTVLLLFNQVKGILNSRK